MGHLGRFQLEDLSRETINDIEARMPKVYADCIREAYPNISEDAPTETQTHAPRQMPLLIGQHCINASLSADCARACQLALVVDRYAFFSKLLRAMAMMLGANPGKAVEVVPCHQQWWPLSIRAGPLTGTQALAFQPVDTPSACVPPPFFDPKKSERVFSFALLRLTRIGSAQDERQSTVLLFRIAPVVLYPRNRYWRVETRICKPAGAGNGAEQAQCRAAFPAFHRKWDDVTAQLSKHISEVVTAWDDRRFGITVEFPGWLHIVDVDTQDLDQWAALARATFDVAATTREGLPVRVANSRDGTVVVTADTWSPYSGALDQIVYEALDPADAFVVSRPMDKVPPRLGGDEGAWRATLDEWVAAVFERLGGGVRLPRPGHFAAMSAVLRFTLPFVAV
jgi:hypothetical protein